MNKLELIKSLSARTSFPETSCRKILDAFADVLGETLNDNSTVMLQGFGTFHPWHQVERLGRNPRTGESCNIRSRTSVKFKPGKSLLKALNSR